MLQLLRKSQIISMDEATCFDNEIITVSTMIDRPLIALTMPCIVCEPDRCHQVRFVSIL